LIPAGQDRRAPVTGDWVMYSRRRRERAKRLAYGLGIALVTAAMWPAPDDRGTGTPVAEASLAASVAIPPVP